MKCNIRLPDAENHYVMRIPKFFVMNTRTKIIYIGIEQ